MYHENDDARCRHCGSDGDHEEWCPCYEDIDESRAGVGDDE